MISSWQEGFVIFFRTVSQILTAGIAITAFALLLYAMTFNLRDRVARMFAAIMVCVAIVFSAEALGSSPSNGWEIGFWLRAQWVGIILLPAVYLHFSDALLATTGKPSRWRRYLAVRVSYIISFLLLLLLALDDFVGPVTLNEPPAPHLQPTLLTDLFIVYYIIMMAMSWYNFARAYSRTTTSTSRRRMAYLLTGALAPAVGSFPFLLYGSTFAGEHQLLFWFGVSFVNLTFGALIVIMAYAVAFFGVPWPDRVVKSRLFKWILRGPIMASVVLGLVTVVRRLGEAFGTPYSALVPIVMVITILMGQYLITLFSPLWERVLFYGKDREDLTMLRDLQNHMLTSNDLRQFVEMVLAAMRDRLQAPGAYVAALDGDRLDLTITTGRVSFNDEDDSARLLEMVMNNGDETPKMFQWGSDYILPLIDSGENDETDWELIGLLGVCGIERMLDEEETQAMTLLSERVSIALRDRRMQQELFRSLQSLSPGVDIIQRMRAAGRYDEQTLLQDEVPEMPRDMTQWVKDALTHYWGGPKLTESPLMALKVVQDALEEHEGNQANALRSILRKAVDQVKPEGERRFTAEWILYNILELKFLEGRKVREVALRLAMSEADLYRKQRIAIEAVAKAILEMEQEIHHQVGP